MKTLIKNALAIVTCDRDDRVLWNHDLLIENQEIIAIGKNLKAEEARVLDATGKFIYPGLVNTHHHFFQTFIRNLTTIDYPRMDVVSWLDNIYMVFRRIDESVIYYSSLTAMADLVKHGCTTAFDHHYCFTPTTGQNVIDRQMEAADKIGLRFHAGRGTNTLPRSEGSTMPAEMVETTDRFISDMRRIIGKYHDTSRFSRHQVVIAPCQPVNCYRDTFVRSAELAKETGVRLHTHLGEGENAIMAQRTGKRTVEYLKDTGFLTENSWFAHCWELNDSEYRTLGEYGCGISHCPSPAILGGFDILNIPKLERSGVSVSLGCDGSATNDGSNLLDSVRSAFLMQCYNLKKRKEGADAYQILKCATVEGAKALGREDIGSLETGKAADLFMINTEQLNLTGSIHDPKHLIGRVGLTDEVDTTMVGGEIVFQNHRLSGIDEKRLHAEGEKICTDVLRKPCHQFHNLAGMELN